MNDAVDVFDVAAGARCRPNCLPPNSNACVYRVDCAMDSLPHSHGDVVCQEYPRRSAGKAPPGRGRDCGGSSHCIRMFFTTRLV